VNEIEIQFSEDHAEILFDGVDHADKIHSLRLEANARKRQPVLTIGLMTPHVKLQGVTARLSISEHDLLCAMGWSPPWTEKVEACRACGKLVHPDAPDSYHSHCLPAGD